MFGRWMNVFLLAFAAAFSTHVICWGQNPGATAPTQARVYVGTYTSKASKGIYRFDMDLNTGKVSAVELAGETTSPSFLAVHPSKKFLYAVNEVGSFNGKKTGSVSAFAIDAATGNLTLINQQESGGPGPCHLVVDSTGRTVLVANYSGGSVASIAIQQNGGLGEVVSTMQHQADAATAASQPKKQPLGHSINLDANNRFAFAADKGLDKVFSYRFDAAKSLLIPNDPPAAVLAPNAGPRHFAFHPAGKYGYVINEISSSVTVFAYDAAAGKLTEIQTVSTLPMEVKGNSTAEIVVHPSGKFLYGSNRGHDSLAIFSIDESTGKLVVVGHQSTGGKTPRNFAIDPTGKFVLSENQNSGTIHVFSVDQSSGKLTATGTVIEVASPVCVKFVTN